MTNTEAREQREAFCRLADAIRTIDAASRCRKYFSPSDMERLRIGYDTLAPVEYALIERRHNERSTLSIELRGL